MANLSAVLFDVRLAFFALFVSKLLIYSVFSCIAFASW